jgi:nucleolar protein 56
MELVAWYGRVDTESRLSIPPGDHGCLVDRMTTNGLADRQPDLRALAKACHFVESDEEYNRRLRDFAIEKVKRELKLVATTEAEALSMIEALDDLDIAINLLNERLYEWSLLHRDELTRDRDLAASLAGEGKGAMGNLASAILDLKRSRQQIEQSLTTEISSIAPNLSSLAGPLLAARLLSRAGSLRRLSEMPSCTIQVMGAEKSLFKHLKGRAPSPKHGLIYRHPAIANAPKRLRGRLARTLSGKLAIAARIDYYSGEASAELKASLDRRLSDVRLMGARKKP